MQNECFRWFIVFFEMEMEIPKLEQSLTIHNNLCWNICIYDKKLSPSHEVSPLPSTLPETLNYL